MRRILAAAICLALFTTVCVAQKRVPNRGGQQNGHNPWVEVNNKLDLLTSKVDALQTATNATNAKLDNLQSSVNSLLPLIPKLDAVQTAIAGLETQLTAISAAIDSLKPPPPKPTTKLRYTFVSNQAGFDTGIVIVNTNEPGSGAHGTCTVEYHGAMAGGGALPSPQTTVDIAAGQLTAFAISAGGVPGSTSSAAGFQGYILASCNFPNARGYGFFSDVGANRVAADIPVEIIEQ